MIDRLRSKQYEDYPTSALNVDAILFHKYSAIRSNI